MSNSPQGSAEPELDIRVQRLGDEPDSADPSRQVDPARAAALLALRRALAEQQIDPRTLQGAIIVEVPTPAWVMPVSSAWMDVAGLPRRPHSANSFGDLDARSGEWIVFDGESARQRGRLSHATDEVASRLWQGISLLGVSYIPDRHLPADLLRAADLRLSLRPLDAESIRLVAHAVTNDTSGITLAPEVCASLSPVTLRLARRRGQSADDFLQRADRIARQEMSLSSPDAGSSLDDLPGMEEAVVWGRDLARDLAAYGTGRLAWRDIDRGCLLVGPPGTGKTTFAKALAATCGVPLIHASYARWQSAREGHLGDLLSAMAQSFDEARKAAPCVMFIDELDGFHRRGEGRHRDWWAAVIGGLLEHLDGIQGREGVVVVGATNQPDLIDPAILRPGRLDRTIVIPLPDRQALAAILRVHLGAALAAEDLSPAAALAQGGTGADCEKWVRGARRRARNAGRAIKVADLLSEIRGDREEVHASDRRLAAVHEAGHALLQALEHPGSLQYVSIREDRQSGGHTAARKATVATTEAWLGAHLREFLGGRAAEEVVLGQVTGGAGGPTHSDLARATWLAVNAETAMGLSQQPLLWRGLWDGRELATLLMKRPDLAQRAEARLTTAYKDACRLLRLHRPALDVLIEELLKREVLTGAEVEAIAHAGGRS